MVLEWILFGAVLVVHTFLAAVMTRYFRIRAKTRWGALAFTVFLVPLVLFAGTLLFSGVLGIGPALGGPGTVLAVMVGMPLVFGYTVDVLYVPPPEEYELPETRS
jgi:hypothetical protein